MMFKVNDAIFAHVSRIADLAGETAFTHVRNPLNVEQNEGESPVTQADKAVEARGRQYLERHSLADRIDATRPFLSGHPMFGFLRARLPGERPDVGVIGMPVLGKTLAGWQGSGPTANVSATTPELHAQTLIELER